MKVFDIGTFNSTKPFCAWNPDVKHLKLNMHIHWQPERDDMIGQIIKHMSKWKAPLPIERITLSIDAPFYSNSIIPLIEAIGRLPIRCDVCINVKLDFFKSVAWGNIAGLYIFDRGRRTGSELEEWGVENLHKTRIVRAGMSEDGELLPVVDNVTIAQAIWSDPKSTQHSTTKRAPKLAFALRKQRDLVRAYNAACTSFALWCKSEQIPKDVMRLITGQVSPGDWDKRGMVVKEPIWAKRVIKEYQAYKTSCSEARKSQREREATEERLLELEAALKKLPEDIKKSQKRERDAQKAQDEAYLKLQAICDDLDKDAYGRPQASRKKRKNE